MPNQKRIPFIAGAPVCGDRFIDRVLLMERLHNLIKFSAGNILIFGKRRIGKTSLCLRLCEMNKDFSDILIDYMSMEANYDCDQVRFVQAVLLRIIARTAQVLYSKRYSELLFDLAMPNAIGDKDYKRLLRLFELARGFNRTLGHSSTKTAGASLVAKAELGEGTDSKITVGQLEAFEILNLLEEIVDFLDSKNIGRFVLVIDEANKLTLEANSRIIRENLSLFSSKGLQFCFVTTPEVIEGVSEVEDLFNEKVEVGAFESIDCVTILIEQYSSSIGDSNDHALYSADAIGAIWTLSKGMPYVIQQLCSKSLTSAFDENAPQVLVKHVLDAFPDLGITI